MYLIAELEIGSFMEIVSTNDLENKKWGSGVIFEPSIVDREIIQSLQR